MSDKVLWLRNNTGSDVHLSDLGVKVGKLKTINPYKYNPYITTAQVELSRDSGSLRRRLESGTLTVVPRHVTQRPPELDRVEVSDQVVDIVKVKTSVVIDTKELDVLDDDDLGDFADYGLGELGHKNTNFAKTPEGAIVVNQLQDELGPDESDATTTLSTITATNSSAKSTLVVTELAEKSVDPVGPIADDTAPEQPFVVVKPPKEVIPKEAKAKIGTKVSRDDSGTITMSGVSDDYGKSELELQQREAVKDDTGAVVMRVKEDAPAETEDTPKAKPAKVKKATKKAARKKKASKK